MLTVKEYLENIVEILNSNSDKKYVIKCFEYPVQYGFLEEEIFVNEFVENEKFIAITTDDFDMNDMFQGFLTYPEEYPHFYSEGNFILCFHLPDELGFGAAMNIEVKDIDLCKDFHGFINFESLFQNKEDVLSRTRK